MYPQLRGLPPTVNHAVNRNRNHPSQVTDTSRPGMLVEILGLWGTGPWVCSQTRPRVLHARRRACVVSCHSSPNRNFWGWTSTSDGLIRRKQVWPESFPLIAD